MTTTDYPTLKQLRRKIVDILRNLFVYLKSILPYKHINVKKQSWDVQYKKGVWDRLNDVIELSRYSVISGYAYTSMQEPEVLDIGCGDGILQEYLYQYGYKNYLGIDISNEAIRTANENAPENTTFLQADAANYNPNKKFDLIIFNECLYYFENPKDIVYRYLRNLKHNGNFIISMYDQVSSKKLWRLFNSEFTLHDATKITNVNARFTWTVAVYKNQL